MDKETTENDNLPEMPDEAAIETLEENRNAAVSLAQQASLSLDLFSPDLEDEIYNNSDFERAVFELVTRHPSTRVRILCKDTAAAIQQGHRLVRLAQTLTSSIAIHRPSEEYRREQSSFLIADRSGLLYRLPATRRNYHASFSRNAPQRAASLLDFFNEAWEHSQPDIQTRRIYV